MGESLGLPVASPVASAAVLPGFLLLNIQAHRTDITLPTVLDRLRSSAVHGRSHDADNQQRMSGLEVRGHPDFKLQAQPYTEPIQPASVQVTCAV